MEMFFIILILQHSHCENTLQSSEHQRRTYFAICYETLSLFFPVILASIYEIPYCFNILSMTICVCLLQNANKCSCYSVKSSDTTIVVQIWNNSFQS